MNTFLNWALGSDRLEIGMEGVHFSFAHELPLYIWIGLVGVCVATGIWAYRGLKQWRALRWVLVCSRAGLLLLLIVLLAGPLLERNNDTIEPDWIMVLVDRSQSLTVADVQGTLAGTSRTRDEQLRGAIEESKDSFFALAEGRELRWFGVGDGAYELPLDESGLPILKSPDAKRTMLGSAIQTAMDRAAARPLAGILLISDGRSLDVPDRALMRSLRSAGAPLHTVRLGSTGHAVDIAVRRVSAPEIAFLNDPVPIVVDIFGLGRSDEMAGTVRLVEEESGEILREVSVPGASGLSQVTLTYQPQESGSQRLRVEFVPDGSDLIGENNSAAVAISIVDRPVRVLYLDGYPRWEQRYLRNLLLRESTVESSSLMLAANRRYLQEGDREIISLPESPEEWAHYDVIVLGDIDPGVFTPSQIEQIRLFVAEEGGGLVWIGGESETPYSWWSTPLASILPFSRSSQTTSRIASPVQVRPTAEAERLGVLRLSDEDAMYAGWPSELTDPSVGWSALHWAQQINTRNLKPTSAVLAEAVPLSGDTPTPLVMTMRYGAGRTVYVATDEIWRWRYGRGEELYERFWVQIIRLLGRDRLARGDRGYELSTGSVSVNVGDALPITLKITDQSLLESTPMTLRALASSADISLDVSNQIDIELTANTTDPGRYSAVWTPPAAGRWELSVVDPVLQSAGQRPATISIEATLPGGELSDPRPDHEFLRSLSESTGGVLFDVEDLPTISDPGVFPSRSVRRVSVERETLWDTPAALVLLLLLTGTEWIGRRILRML